MLLMADALAIAAPHPYRPIPPEPWGRRLTRARVDVANLTLADAAALAGQWMLTTDSTISRLESLDAVPSGPRNRSRRQLAYILCLAYMVDPAEFELTGDDLPPGLAVPHRAPRDQGKSSIKWFAAAA